MPAFRDGVLFSSTTTKGRIAKVFLDRIGWTPSEVILVDDQEQHAKSVTEEMREMGIPSTVYHYTKAEDSNNQIDPDLAQFQVRFLLENHIWLSDKEARKVFQ